MRFSTVLPFAIIAPLVAAQAINITQVEQVDQVARQGELAYGASNLAFGYSAGAGINFSNGKSSSPIPKRLGMRNNSGRRLLMRSMADTVGGGFNAGIPGQSEGALGGGWTLTGRNLTFGFGGVFNNISVNVAIFSDRTTGTTTVHVNGKEVAM
ncbi:hypothetical protein PVAG01_09069 [Phlyctema vagabunda]|uniref:Uncharacterized protein n=1 Tax=Phlyctema vagabunda TaxID=108571 RepID=A0ABR4P6A9_9HELO